MLATSLLMPKNQVKKAFFKVRNRTNAVAELAELFGVSKQAMAIFLTEHNMV
jgi:Zn-dependent peptidase ImmA (M78 family)